MVTSFEILGKVHEQRVDPNSGETVVTGENHYIRIKSAGRPAIFLRKGHAMDENGVLLKEVPDWLWTEINKCSEGALRNVGWAKRQEDGQNLATQTEATPTKKKWSGPKKAA